MEVYLNRQLYQLACAFIFGILAGVLYDAMRVTASLLANNRVKTAVSDTLFWITTILSVFFFNIAFFSGETSWYFPFAMAVGGSVYMHLLSGQVVALLNLAVLPVRIVLRGLRAVARFVKKCILRVYIWISNGSRRFATFVKRIKRQKTIKNSK